MAVRLNPCFGCPLRQGCELRDEWRAKVNGLGLSSATFKCPRLSDAIRPGRRITVELPRIVAVGNYELEEEARRGSVEATATVLGFDGLHFTCVLDPDQAAFDEAPPVHDPDKARFLKRRRYSRIKRFLDEPDLRLCPGGNVLRNDHCDTSIGRCNCSEGRWL